MAIPLTSFVFMLIASVLGVEVPADVDLRVFGCLDRVPHNSITIHCWTSVSGVGWPAVAGDSSHR